jgi:hypothetical protein
MTYDTILPRTIWDLPLCEQGFWQSVSMAFLSDLQAMVLKGGPARHYSEETYAACFIIRTFSSRAYEFIRYPLILSPQQKHVDEYLKPVTDLIQSQTGMLAISLKCSMSTGCPAPSVVSFPLSRIMSNNSRPVSSEGNVSPFAFQKSKRFDRKRNVFNS